jgi:hypothetical protein
MVKIYTMVKDECDIIKDWILYHGYLFGFNNLYIIDNYSTDGTYEIINEFKNDVHVFREVDYKKKGVYMTNLINKYSEPNELSFPIDIDEFIVYYDKKINKINTNKEIISDYLKNIPKKKLYKMNYIIVEPDNKSGYKQATIESNYGYYSDYGNHAKSFINMTLFNNIIDHGNHINSKNFYLTDLCLLHFHERNLEQIKKKIINNCSGFNYDISNVSKLKQLILHNPCVPGNHHVNKMIKVLENTYELNYRNYTDADIKIDDFTNKIKELNIIKL